MSEVARIAADPARRDSPLHGSPVAAIPTSWKVADDPVRRNRE
jgi:hypothetical protein